MQWINSWLKRLLQAKDHLKRGNDLYDKGNVQGAILSFNKILEIEKDYPGLKETIEKVRRVGDCYTRAKDLQSQGKTLAAVAQWRKILSLERDSANFFYREAEQYLEKLKLDLSKREGEARELYRDGYVLRDINPEKAIENWKKILELVPPDSEYYIKAKKMLEKY